MDQVVRVPSTVKGNLQNALQLNRQMQLQLLMVRDKIEKLLKSVKEIYQTNEDIVSTSIGRQTRKGVGMRGAYLRGGTFYLKGNMFFKDINCRNCPDNSDYTRRKAQGEIFPRDLDLKGRHVWSTRDKKGLVEGIKEQIIQHAKSMGKSPQNKKYEINSEKLVNLLDMVSSDFHIDWDVISKHNLNHRHTAMSCEAIWNVYLHPTLKRSAWTEKENQKLLEAIKKYNFQDWSAIATELKGRSDFQCFVQYQNYVCYMMNERSAKWTREDDERLVEVIERNTVNGQINWSNVMLHFPQKPRTTLQCRYTYSLNPRINREPFTPEEDLLLLAAIEEYGTKFAYIPRVLFPNRTTVQLRCRYQNTLMNRHKQNSWTLEDDTKLMDFVAENGTSSWKQCAEVVERHNRISCRTRYYVIHKYFQKNPEATLVDLKRKVQKQWSYVNAENWTEKLDELRQNPGAQLVKRIKKKQPPGKKRKPRAKKEKVPKPPKPRKVRVKKEKITKVKPKQDRKKPVYIERLRVNGLKMYQSLKYAYNFKLGEDPLLTNIPKYHKLRFVKTVLGLQNRADEKNVRFDNSVPGPLRPRIIKNIKGDREFNIPPGFSLPTSWSTAMAFRALCIQTAQPDLEVVTSPIVDDNNEHICKFRERLRILFYTTALLSRLHPAMVGVTGNFKNPPNQVLVKCEQLVAESNAEKHNLDTNSNDDDSESPPIKRPKIVRKSLLDQVLSIKREMES